VLYGGDAEGAGDALFGEVHVDYGVELIAVLSDPVCELVVDGAVMFNNVCLWVKN
jgi:hypothetical protein